MTEHVPAGQAVPASRPFRVALDFGTGSLLPFGDSLVRRLSDVAGMYEDQAAVSSLLGRGENPVVYRAYDAGVPHRADHLIFRTTIIDAGTVGSEFFMTKGHHHDRDSAELYIGMSGEGLMLMQTRDGVFCCQELTPHTAVYVPPGWAHRTVNTGAAPLIFLAAYFADAGHDYAAVERSGFSRRVHRGEAGPELRPAAAAAGEVRECT